MAENKKRNNIRINTVPSELKALIVKDSKKQDRSESYICLSILKTHYAKQLKLKTQ